jgi:hypothetical protein
MGAEVITSNIVHDRYRVVWHVRAMASVNQCYFDINGLDTGGCGKIYYLWSSRW